MGAIKQMLLEEMGQRSELCRNCEKRPATHKCTCCDEVALCIYCAADLFGAMCPDCGETLTKDD
jgi:hypothetical protein